MHINEVPIIMTTYKRIE